MAVRKEQNEFMKKRHLVKKSNFQPHQKRIPTGIDEIKQAKKIRSCEIMNERRNQKLANEKC